MKKKYTFLSNHSKKIVLAVLVSMIWITTLTPMVLALNTKINVTFDPDGTVSIDVWPKSYAFGVVYAGGVKLTTITYFTVWDNSSTISTKIQLQTNATSNPPGTGMTYNPAASPGSNAFALNTTSFTTSNTYIPINTYSTDYHTLAAASSKQFGLRIVIGSPLTTNLSTQTMEIRFRGVSV